MCAWGVHEQQTQEARSWLLLTPRRGPHLSQLALQLCDLFYQVLPLIFRGHVLEAAEVLWEAVVSRVEGITAAGLSDANGGVLQHCNRTRPAQAGNRQGASARSTP